jgi:hypothetical protein
MPWNEIEYLPWDRFHRMTPPILALEISRLDDLIRSSGNDIDLRNALVKVRYELTSFLNELESDPNGLSATTSGHLETAILNLPLDRVTAGGAVHTKLSYVLDRLQSIHKRIELLYR